MLKLIAILVLSSQLSVAVETDSGWVEKSFPNSPAGAEQLVDFAESSLGATPGGVRVTVGRLDDTANLDPIVDFLADAGVKHGLTAPDDIRKAAVAHQVPETSAMAVAYADIARFGFIYRRTPK